MSPLTRKLLHKWSTAKCLMKLGAIRDGLALPLTPSLVNRGDA
jgi:hypothetical protein